MEHIFNAIQKLLWLVFKVIYTLATPLLFIFLLYLFFKSVDNDVVKNCISFYINFPVYVKYILLFSFAVILSLSFEAVSNVIAIGKIKTNTINEDSNFLDEIVIDGDLKVKDAGYSHLAGFKTIEQHENFYAYISFYEAKKTILSGLQICLGLILAILLPVLYLKAKTETPEYYFLLILIEIIVLFTLFLITNYLLGNKFLEAKSGHWGDIIIVQWHDILFSIIIPIVLGLVLLFINFHKSWSPFSNCILLQLSFTFLIFPINFLLTIWQVNVNNRIRKLMKSAFIHLRYKDKIFPVSK